MATERVITQVELLEAAEGVARRIVGMGMARVGDIGIYGIPSDGVPAAYVVQHAAMSTFGYSLVIVDDPKDALIFIDDIIDSGKTRDLWQSKYGGKPVLALFDKQQLKDGRWYIFPWDRKNPEASASDIVTRLLEYIGEDPKRPGLVGTPARVLKAWKFWTSGYVAKPDDLLVSFVDGAEKYDEMVVEANIPIWSLCEHHLAPFFGVAHVGYLPSGRVVGLSKLVRLVEVFARRLQVQERLTQQIAHALAESALKPLGVGVVLQCRHSCMESRGAQRAGIHTSTSCMLGALREQTSARGEFMRLIGAV